MSVRILILAFVAVASAAGFAQAAPVTTPDKVDKRSSGYRSGFMDGCEHATTGNPRNEGRFSSDFNYHEGWVVGYKSCYPHQTVDTNNDPNGPLKF